MLLKRFIDADWFILARDQSTSIPKMPIGVAGPSHVPSSIEQFSRFPFVMLIPSALEAALLMRQL
jgi:hypothetical protein